MKWICPGFAFAAHFTLTAKGPCPDDKILYYVYKYIWAHLVPGVHMHSSLFT